MSSKAATVLAQARSITNSLRSIRSVSQLEAVAEEVKGFLCDQTSNLAAALESVPILSDCGPDGRRSTTPWLSDTIVVACTLLCGAFIRKARLLFLSLDVDSNVCMPQVALLRETVAEVRRRVRELERPAAAQAAYRRKSSLSHCVFAVAALPPPTRVASPLSYALREERDFNRLLTCRAQDRVRRLTGRFQWDIEGVVQAIREMSEIVDEQGGLLSERKTHSLRSEIPTETLALTPLRDPLSGSVISLPARGLSCSHWDVFDVTSFVRAAQQGLADRFADPGKSVEAGSACPFCRRFIPLTDVRVDPDALAGMEAYRTALCTSKGAEAAVESELTVHHALQWDLQHWKCTVVFRKRLCAEAEAAPVATDDGIGDTTEKGNVGKRRRVEIGGHVLYVDE